MLCILFTKSSHTQGRFIWDANCEHFSGYREAELEECVSLICNFIATTTYDKVYKKYSGRKFMKCSIFALDWITKAVHNHTRIMDGRILVGTHRGSDE